MTDAELELARRLVASPRWRWIRGMTVRHGELGPCLVLLEEKRFVLFAGMCGSTNPKPLVGWLPDLADPATLGCLVALLPLGSGPVDLSIARAPAHGTASIFIRDERCAFDGETVGEALARALLVAWGET